MAEPAKGLNRKLFQRACSSRIDFSPLPSSLLVFYLSHLNPFFSLWFSFILFFPPFFLHFRSFTRSSFFVCLTTYVYLRLSQAYFARIGITAVLLSTSSCMHLRALHISTRNVHPRALKRGCGCQCVNERWRW